MPTSLTMVWISLENDAPGHSNPLSEHSFMDKEIFVVDNEIFVVSDELYVREALLNSGHFHSGTTFRNIGRSIAQATGVSNMLTRTKTRLWYGPKDPSCRRTSSNSNILDFFLYS